MMDGTFNGHSVTRDVKRMSYRDLIPDMKGLCPVKGLEVELRARWREQSSWQEEVRELGWSNSYHDLSLVPPVFHISSSGNKLPPVQPVLQTPVGERITSVFSRLCLAVLLLNPLLLLKLY